MVRKTMQVPQTQFVDKDQLEEPSFIDSDWDALEQLVVAELESEDLWRMAEIVRAVGRDGQEGACPSESTE